MEQAAFQSAVLAWYDRHGRKHLPWQTPRDPYRVWVSEIMLQQTQVATVIPYFERFMARWPTVAALAEAELDAVLALWAGLGYYARARHLHRAAREIQASHGGRLPDSLAELEALPGIGRSTAGAILSLGHGRRAAILDGNVKRLLCRQAGLSGWPGSPAVNRQLWALSERLTPTERAGDYNQAMMDLGALVCTRARPLCAACPVAERCVARATGAVQRLPTPKPRRPLPVRTALFLLLRDAAGRVWLETRPPSGIWGGLRCLPEFDSPEALRVWCLARRIPETGLVRLPVRRHSFTHHHLDFETVLATVTDPTGVAEAGGGWCDPVQAEGLPAPIRTLLGELGAGAPA